jgi:hypothetical protein
MSTKEVRRPKPAVRKYKAVLLRIPIESEGILEALALIRKEKYVTIGGQVLASLREWIHKHHQDLLDQHGIKLGDEQ